MVFCQISFVEPGKVGLGKNNGIVETLIGNAVIKFKRFAKVFSTSKNSTAKNVRNLAI